jgi:adenylate kinase
MTIPVATGRSLNIVLIGPPGAGKSTIAEGLIDHYPFVMVSTGDWLRRAIKSRLEIGRIAEQYIRQGNLVPDRLMDRALREILATFDPEQGLLLDGYPRTYKQAVGLFGLLADHQRSLDAVIALDIEDEQVVRRLSGRRICECANDQFPVHIDDLASMIRCKDRNGTAVQRDDDRPEVVRQRLTVYHEQTKPLIQYYENHGLLLHVDASATPAEVSRRAIAALQHIHV